MSREHQYTHCLLHKYTYVRNETSIICVSLLCPCWCVYVCCFLLIRCFYCWCSFFVIILSSATAVPSSAFCFRLMPCIAFCIYRKHQWTVVRISFHAEQAQRVESYHQITHSLFLRVYLSLSISVCLFFFLVSYTPKTLAPIISLIFAGKADRSWLYNKMKNSSRRKNVTEKKSAMKNRRENKRDVRIRQRLSPCVQKLSKLYFKMLNLTPFRYGYTALKLRNVNRIKTRNPFGRLPYCQFESISLCD